MILFVISPQNNIVTIVTARSGVIGLRDRPGLIGLRGVAEDHS